MKTKLIVGVVFIVAMMSGCVEDTTHVVDRYHCTVGNGVLCFLSDGTYVATFENSPKTGHHGVYMNMGNTIHLKTNGWGVRVYIIDENDLIDQEGDRWVSHSFLR